MALANYKFTFANGTKTVSHTVRNLDANANAANINLLGDSLKYFGEYDSKVSITKIVTTETEVEIINS